MTLHRTLTLGFLTLAACAPVALPPAEPLPFFGPGYRADGDPCRRVGESSATSAYLDDAADLVGCPSDMENLGVFAIDTGGILVGRVGGTSLYSVPRR